MEYRQLGRSGLRVSVLTLGTMTFGGRGNFAAVGTTDVAGARRQVDRCLDAGINLFDTADVYSAGLSEEILGEVLEGRRDDVLVATKARMPMGDGPNDAGLSRHHLIRSCEASLRRLRTDHIDLYQVHEWDGQTPLEETLDALDTLVRDGKVRYVGCSNYAGWQLMKALGVSERARPRALRQPADLPTRCRPATPSTSSSPPPSTRASASSSGARWPAACCPASTAAAARRPGGRAPAHRLGRAARARRATRSTTSSTCSSRSPRRAARRPAQVALAWLLGRPA